MHSTTFAALFLLSALLSGPLLLAWVAWAALARVERRPNARLCRYCRYCRRSIARDIELRLGGKRTFLFCGAQCRALKPDDTEVSRHCGQWNAEE